MITGSNKAIPRVTAALIVVVALVVLAKVTSRPVLTAPIVPETLHLSAIRVDQVNDITQAGPKRAIAAARMNESGLFLLSKSGGMPLNSDPILIRTDLKGRTLFSIPLAPAGATSFQILPSGNLLLYQYQKEGGTFREIDSQGAEVASVPKQRPFRYFALSGSRLVRFSPDLSWDHVPLSLSSRMEPSSAGIGVAARGEVLVETERAAGREDVWLIEKATGRLTRLNPLNGARAEFTIQSPDLAQSIAAYDDLRRRAPDGGARFGEGLAVISSAMDADSNLYLALSPYKTGGQAVILQVDQSGVVKRRLLCSLAVERPELRIDPSYMGITGKNLYLVSGRGNIGVFNLP